MLGQRIWLGVLVAGVLTAPSAGAAASIQATPQFSPSPTSPRLRVFGAARAPLGRRVAGARLDGALAEISQPYATISAAHPLADLHAINPEARFRLSAPLAVPEVLIDAVTTGDPQALKSAPQNLGLRDVAAFANDVGGWLPVDQIAEASSLTELRFARASMPRTRAGPVATQGDFAQRSADIRAGYPSLTGAGITVGVLSDSFDCYQIYANDGVPASGSKGYASNGFTASYATDQSTGALPAGLRALEEASCMRYGEPVQLPFSDEGRALLQIVHAVAPGARLAFYTAENSEADFASGIVKLAQAGARIIDDDVGYPDEPFFQDGVVAQAIEQVSASGVAYFSSAGNDRRISYENTAPTFPVTSASGLNAGEQLLNFDTSGATTVTSLPLTIPALFPGEYVTLIVEWDQPFVTGAPDSGGATSSLDLCVMGAPGADSINFAPAAAAVNCTGPNATGADPVQLLVIGNPAYATASTPAESLRISIGLANGSRAPGRIKFAVDGDGAAAAAAVMWQANPAVIAAQIDAALALLPPAPPSISVSPTSVTIGSSATLTWSSINTTGCSASGIWIGVQSTSGSQSITPTTTGANTYTLTCAESGGTNTNSVVLTANANSSGSGGGGGRLDEISLLALCGALLLRRRPVAGPSRPVAH